MFKPKEERDGWINRESSQEAPMKVSEAMRIGAKRRAQCRGSYFSDYGESCALGAAAEGMFGVNRMTFSTKHIDQISAALSTDIVSLIIGKNDAGWTREQIADWLESQGY